MFENDNMQDNRYWSEWRRQHDKEMDSVKKDVKDIKEECGHRAKANVALVTTMEHLIKKVDSLVTMLLTFSASVALTLIGFVLWYIQTL